MNGQFRLRTSFTAAMISELAAACYQLAKRIAIAKELTAVMERDLGGIIRHAAAGRKAGRIGMRAAEVVEPECRIVVAWIVFHQGELGPAHGAVVPAGGGGGRREGLHGGGRSR